MEPHTSRAWYGDEQRPLRLGLKERPLALTALALIIGLYLWRAWILKTAAFDPDEFWHLHSAWCLSRGVIPYRDFFEHHTPWLYFLLAPIFRFYPVDSDPNAAIAFIFLARTIMIFFAAVALILTFVLGYLWRGYRIAWVSTALLSTSLVFAHKTLEIRPDGPALVLWLGCLATLVQAVAAPQIKPEITEPKRGSLFILSGILLGGAIMTEQKMLVLMPGFCLAMLWYLVGGRGATRQRLLHCLLQFAAFCVSIIATSLFFLMHGAFGVFFESILMNVGWKTHLPAYLLTGRAIAQNPFLAAFGSLGLIRAAFHGRRFSKDRLLFLNTVGAIGGVFALPTPWLQNYLMFLPLLALYAADLLVFVADRIRASDPGFSRLANRLATALAFGLIASGGMVLVSAPAPPAIHLLFAMTLVIGIALLFEFPGIALPILLIAFSVDPIYLMRNALRPTNQVQLERLRYVLANTLPTDTVMDGFSGLSVFRCSAWFYPFIHGEIARLLSANDRDQLLLGLRSGKIAPKFIFPTAAMWSISRPVTIFLLTHYQPVCGASYIRRRK